MEENKSLPASGLFYALENGKILEKDFALAYPENYHKLDVGEFVQYVIFNKEHGYLEKKGWSSAYGTEEGVAFNILRHPEQWRVSEYSIEDRPWSVDFKKKQKEKQEEQPQ